MQSGVWRVDGVWVNGVRGGPEVTHLPSYLQTMVTIVVVVLLRVVDLVALPQVPGSPGRQYGIRSGHGPRHGLRLR